MKQIKDVVFLRLKSVCPLIVNVMMMVDPYHCFLPPYNPLKFTSVFPGLSLLTDMDEPAEDPGSRQRQPNEGGGQTD